jgi:hypothetical protein
MYWLRTECCTRFSSLFAIFLAAVLCGCATTSFNAAKQEFSGSTPVTAIYVYSFLDLREGNLGKNFLADFQRQLAEALSQEGIRTKQLWFNDSPVRGQFSLEATGPNPSKTSTRVPVAEVVKATQDDERQFGASHRLVVFPAFVMSSNTGSNFHIRWELVDARTNQSVWTTTSRSHHMKWFLGDENAHERASIVVQGLMSELRNSKVIGRGGS